MMLKNAIQMPLTFACWLFFAVTLLSGCDTQQSVPPNSASPPAGPPTAVGVKTPPVSASLQPLLAEMDDLGKRQKKPDSGPYMLKSLDGKPPYALNPQGDLISIDLNCCPATDEFLAKLKDLPALESINLMNTQITDAGLEYLDGIKTLKDLEVENTQVSEETAMKFRESHPQCKVRVSAAPK